MRFLAIHFFILILLVVRLSAQDNFNWQNLTIEDGLPSDEVHDLHFDKDGYLWMATDFGVVKFDGLDYKIYTTTDGLRDNTVFKIHEDKHHRLWFLSYYGGICYFDNEQFIPYQWNEQLIDSFKYTTSYVHDIRFDDADELWATIYRQSGLYHITHEGKITRINDKSDDINAFTIGTRHIGQEGKISFASSKYYDGDCDFCATATATSNVSVHHDPPYTFIRGYGGRMYSWRYIKHLTVNDSIDVFSYQDNSFVIKHDTSLVNVSKSKMGIIEISKGEHNSFCLGFLLGGMKCIDLPLETTLDLDHTYFGDLSVTDVLIGNNGDYWISTVEEGIYHLPNMEMEMYGSAHGLPNEKLTLLLVINDKLYAGSVTGSLYRLDSYPGNDFTTLYSIREKVALRTIWEIAPGEILLQDGLLVNEHFEPIKYDCDFGGYNYLTINDSTYIAGSAVIRVVKNKEVFYETDKIFSKVTSFCQLDDNNFLIGSRKGVYQLTDTTIHRDNLTHECFNHRTVDIQKDGLNNFWIATKGYGLYCISGNDTLQYTVDDGLSSSLCKRMYLLGDTSVWVSTNQGLNKLVYNPEDPSQFSIENFNTHHGLPGNETDHIQFWQNKLWVISGANIVSFNPNKLQLDSVAPKLVIQSAGVNGKPRTVFQNMEFKPSENSVTFSYNGIAPLSFGKVSYKYRLVGLNDQWTSTKERSVQYTKIPPGHYTLELLAANADGIWMKDPEQLNFTVMPTFFQTWYFILLVILLSVLFIALVIRLRLQYITRQINFKLKLIETEQKALRAQVNPHFLYNTLNAIQSLVVERNVFAASEGIAQFSKMMRNVLENSKQSLISLNKELQVAEQYLALEKMRLGDRFEYSIDTDENIDLSLYQIPPMLIQPILENSIWHGILPKENRQGIVKIVLHDTQHHLLLSVIDNGVGRKTNTKNRHSGHSSMGINLIKERLRLANESHSMDFRFEIHDLNNADSSPAGTKMTIMIPPSL